MTVTEKQITDGQINTGKNGFYTPAEIAYIQKLTSQRDCLKHYFKERDDAIDVFFLCLLAKQHLVMIGPPGTAKSYLIESFTEGFSGYDLFQWQVTKFTTPEELFGPYSLVELKKGNYKRITDTKLPKCNIAYIDEVFNANSSILNALNSSMNERMFEGDGIDLDCLFGATNFQPEESVLVAFFDRFLFRLVIDEISESKAFEEMLSQGDYTLPKAQKIDKSDIVQLQTKLQRISTKHVVHLMVKLREALKEESIYPSSRRFRWAMTALQANALLDGRDEVIDEDLFILKHILWTEKKEIPIVEQIIARVVAPALAKVKELLTQANEMRKNIKNADPKKPDELASIMETLEKLKMIKDDIEKIIKKEKVTDKVKEVAEKIISEITSSAKEIQQEKLKFAF